MIFNFFIVYYNLFNFYFMLIIDFFTDFKLIYLHNSYYYNLDLKCPLQFLHYLDHHRSPLLKFHLCDLNFFHYFHRYIPLIHLISYLHNFHPFNFELIFFLIFKIIKLHYSLLHHHLQFNTLLCYFMKIIFKDFVITVEKFIFYFKFPAYFY